MYKIKQYKRITAIALTLLLLCSVFILPGASAAATASGTFIGEQSDIRFFHQERVESKLTVYSDEVKMEACVPLYQEPPAAVTVKIVITFKTSSGLVTHEIKSPTEDVYTLVKFSSGDFKIQSAIGYVTVDSRLNSEINEFSLSVGQ